MKIKASVLLLSSLAAAASGSLMAEGMSMHKPPSDAPATPSTTPAPDHQMMGMGDMGGMMSDDTLKKKQDHILKIHDLSNKILAATDDKTREQLKAEQFNLLKAFEAEHHKMMMHHMMQMMQQGGMGGMSGGMGNMNGMQHATQNAKP